MEFTYDPELIRELAEELTPTSTDQVPACIRYQRAGIEWYAEVYSDVLMDDIVMGWDEVRGDSPAWSELDDRQRHKVLATVAMHHESADQAWFEDEWSSRIALVFEDDIAGYPGFVIG